MNNGATGVRGGLRLLSPVLLGGVDNGCSSPPAAANGPRLPGVCQKSFELCIMTPGGCVGVTLEVRDLRRSATVILYTLAKRIEV